jgi:hypothetical protein
VRAVGLAATAAVLGVFSGCGGVAGDDPDGPGLRGAEVEWVADYAAWVTDFIDDLSREERARDSVLGDSEAFERYADEVTELRDCRSRLDERLDPPPSDRLLPTLQGLREVCRIVAPAVRRLADATDEGARTGPFVAAAQAVQRAHLHWNEVDASLDRLLLARGPLPRRGGAATVSRIEPTLTSVAEQIADGRAVEVRCWSAADWRRVLEEEEAVTAGELTVDTVGAFAVLGTGTLHLQESDCSVLGRLAYEGWMPGRGDDLDKLALSVSTLSHEIQHVVSPAGEAETECAAVQYNAEVAEELGAPPAYARELADRYWERFYPPGDEQYRSAECRPGGALDLGPETPTWPTG